MTTMKKISQIIAYSLLGLVVLGLVLTAVLKKDFAPNLTVPGYNTGDGYIAIEQKGVANYDGLASKDKDVYNKFVNIYNNSFKLTILYSLFSGEISRKQEITSLEKNAPSLDSQIVVSFIYENGQVLKSNGKVYYESVNSTTEIKYTKVFFAVNQDKGLTSHKIYFQAGSNYYELATLANFDDLYNFIADDLKFVENE